MNFKLTASLAIPLVMSGFLFMSNISLAEKSVDDWPAVKQALLTTGFILHRDSNLVLRRAFGIQEEIPEFNLTVETFNAFLFENGLPGAMTVTSPKQHPINGILTMAKIDRKDETRQTGLCTEIDATTCVISDTQEHIVFFVIVEIDDSLSPHNRTSALGNSLFASFGVRVDGSDREFANKALRFSYKYLKPGMKEAETKRQFEKYWALLD